MKRRRVNEESKQGVCDNSTDNESLLSLREGLSERSGRNTEICGSGATRSFWSVWLIAFLLLVTFLWCKVVNRERHHNRLEQEDASVISNYSPTRDGNLFESCRLPHSETDAAESSGNQSYCTFFRPTQFFQNQQQGLNFLNVTVADYPSTKFEGWSWQVNNWQSGGSTSPLQLPDIAKLKHIESITVLTIPKSGSRTQWGLFLDHLTPPKKLKQNVRRVGMITPVFLRELKGRQAEQKDHKRRSDIVYAVIRDPTSRFISSIGQLLSMRHMRRCEGCDKYLEPCLTTKGPETESQRDFSISVLRCIVRSLNEHGYWNEHFLPSAVFLTYPLKMVDIQVSLFDLPDLNRVVEAFGVLTPLQRNRRKDKSHEESKAIFGHLQEIVMGNRGHDCDSVVEDICKLYAVDVSIRRFLGFPNMHCS